MSLLISALLALAEKVMEKADVASILTDPLIRVLICYFVVFPEGCLFRMIAFGMII